MAIFSAIIAMLPAGAAWGSVTVFGLSPAVSAAIIAAGKGALWAVAGSALTQPKVPRQQVQATLSQTDAPRIRAYGRNLLGGQRALFEADDGRLHQVIVMHHGQVDGLIRFWVDGEPVELDGQNRRDQYTWLRFRDGSGAGGDYSSEPAPNLSGFSALWTSDHRLQGQATFYVILGDPPDEDFQKIYPKGAYTAVQAEVRASRVRNMAGNMVYSENAGLCIRDLLTHPDGWNIPAARLDTTSWQTFADLCAEAVPLAGGGTEPRYRLCGFYSLDDALKDVTARMLATCDGQIYETAEGQIGILGGAWSEPDVTITSDDILSIEMQDGFDPFTDYNILKGSFVSPAHAYQPTEVGELRDEAALATQEERIEPFDNDMCPASGQLQRLMKIKFAKDRRAQIGTIRTNLVGMKARFPKGDGIHTIRVAAPEYGLDGVFEVTSHSFDIPNVTCEIGVASIENPYGWNAATEEKPLPPGIDELVIPVRGLPPLSGISLTQEIVNVSGGVRGVRLAVRVNDPGRNDLELRAQLTKGTYTAVGPWPDPQPTWIEMVADNYRAESGVLDDGETYTVRVRWRRGGEWVLAGVITVTANPVVPDPPSDFAGAGSGHTANLSWINPTANFYRTQIWRNISSDFETADLIATVDGLEGQPASYADQFSIIGPPPSAQYYWAVTINASGVPSAPAGPVYVTF